MFSQHSELFYPFGYFRIFLEGVHSIPSISMLSTKIFRNYTIFQIFPNQILFQFSYLSKMCCCDTNERETTNVEDKIESDRLRLYK